MQIQTTHEFDATVGSVLSSVTAASYAPFLAREHPFFSDVKVLSIVADPYRVRRYVRYEARPIFSRLGPFSVPPSWFVWTEISVLDLVTRTLTFENVPDQRSLRSKVENKGVMRFEPMRGGRTVRHATFDFDLHIQGAPRVFVKLGMELIAKQLKSSLDDEAKVLSRWTAGEQTAASFSHDTVRMPHSSLAQHG